MAGACGARLRFEARAIGLKVETEGVRGGLGRLLVFVAHAMAEGTWTRLKACSMPVCGNRTKVERYRARHGDGGRP